MEWGLRFLRHCWNSQAAPLSLKWLLGKTGSSWILYSRKEAGKGGVVGAQKIQKPEGGNQEFPIELPFGESEEKSRRTERHYRKYLCAEMLLHRAQNSPREFPAAGWNPWRIPCGDGSTQNHQQWLWLWGCNSAKRKFPSGADFLHPFCSECVKPRFCSECLKHRFCSVYVKHRFYSECVKAVWKQLGECQELGLHKPWILCRLFCLLIINISGSIRQKFSTTAER